MIDNKMMDHRLSGKHFISLGILLAAIIVASIQPLEMQSYLLHQTGTLFMIGMLIFCPYKIGLSFLSFNLYILFLFIHTISLQHIIYILMCLIMTGFRHCLTLT